MPLGRSQEVRLVESRSVPEPSGSPCLVLFQTRKCMLSDDEPQSLGDCVFAQVLARLSINREWTVVFGQYVFCVKWGRC